MSLLERDDAKPKAPCATGCGNKAAATVWGHNLCPACTAAWGDSEVARKASEYQASGVGLEKACRGWQRSVEVWLEQARAA